MELNSSLEMTAMTIIANSGDARSFAMQALQQAKSGNFEEANVLIQQSDAAARIAHEAQTNLLFAEANGTEHKVNILLIHAQDHLMTGMLAVELIREMIDMCKRN